MAFEEGAFKQRSRIEKPQMPVHRSHKHTKTAGTTESCKAASLETFFCTFALKLVTFSEQILSLFVLSLCVFPFSLWFVCQEVNHAEMQQHQRGPPQRGLCKSGVEPITACNILKVWSGGSETRGCVLSKICRDSTPREGEGSEEWGCYEMAFFQMILGDSFDH